MADFLDELKRRFVRPARPMEDKDVGLVIERLGIMPGHRVFEAGVGSGFLTASLARVVYPDGEVVGVDVAEDRVRAVESNLEALGPVADVVELVVGDAAEVVRRYEPEVLVLDMPGAERVVEEAPGSVKRVAVYCPFVDSAVRAVEALEGRGFEVEWLELVERSWSYEVERGVRPRRFSSHTGFLVFGYG
ncbi:MAG: methyltransferase domain-containing protein [Methanopyri archaeon]|nr:methyltransferase domain-containing protein [Methanopyri archaeon]